MSGICLFSCLGGAGRSSTSAKLPSASLLAPAGNDRKTWAAVSCVLGRDLNLLLLLDTPQAHPAPHMSSVVWKELICVLRALPRCRTSTMLSLWCLLIVPMPVSCTHCRAEEPCQYREIIIPSGFPFVTQPCSDRGE